ncbi:MAG: calcium-binding protein [Thermoleophilia bacterium]|nr:calcium-binding protein [Thermoleophilia bacterium]
MNPSLRHRTIDVLAVAAAVLLFGAPTVLAADVAADPFREDATFSQGIVVAELGGDSNPGSLVHRPSGGYFFAQSGGAVVAISSSGKLDTTWGMRGRSVPLMVGSRLLSARQDGSALVVNDSDSQIWAIGASGSVLWKTTAPSNGGTFVPSGDGAQLVWGQESRSVGIEGLIVRVSTIDPAGAVTGEPTTLRPFSPIRPATTNGSNFRAAGSTAFATHVIASPDVAGSAGTCTVTSAVGSGCRIEVARLSAGSVAPWNGTTPSLAIDMPTYQTGALPRMSTTPFGSFLTYSLSGSLRLDLDLREATAGALGAPTRNTPFALGDGGILDVDLTARTVSWGRRGGAMTRRGGDATIAAIDDRGRAWLTIWDGGKITLRRTCFVDPSCTGRATTKLRVGTNRADILRGTWLDDTLRGVGGADRIDGGPSDDVIDGGLGNDTIIGGDGRDILRGGAGNDVIRATDRQQDTVNCGPGRDTAFVSSSDKVVGCERVVRGA